MLLALSILSPLSAICLMVMPSLSLGRQKSSTSLCCMIPLGEPWLPQTLICCLLMQIFWPISITMCFSIELSRNAFALAVLDHVAQSSKLGLGHDAFSGGLQVGSLFIVHVAAQAACQVPQSPLEGLDLHSLVVSPDSHAVLQREDLEDAVLVENHPVALVLEEGGPAGHLGHGLHDLSIDLEGSSGAAPAAPDQLKLVLVVVDDGLDNVLGGGLLQSDHDLGVGGAVPEGHMLAVVEGVVVHHLVEGPHLVVLDGAGGGKAVL